MVFTIPKLPGLNTQPQACGLLSSISCEQRAPSYLFTGPPGAGKATHALALIRTLFCAAGPGCPGCPACRQVLNRTHPDLLWVHRDHFWAQEEEEKKKQEITVKVIQRLTEQVHRAPFSAPLRVSVIPRADTMNVHAQNVLLKTLEEPPSRALLLLLAERPGRLLPTVLSRCRTVRFVPVEAAGLEEALVASHGFSRADAQEAALWSDGDFKQALRYADPGWRVFRDQVVVDFDRAVSGTTRDWLEVSLQYEKLKWEFDDEEDLTDAQIRRRSVQAVLGIFLSLWAKRLRGVFPVPEPFRRLASDQVAAAIDRHMEILEGNLPPRMVLDHLFLTLREGLRTGEIETRSFFDLAVS